MTRVAVNDAKSSSTFSELSASALYDINQGQHHRENAQKDLILVACVIKLLLGRNVSSSTRKILALVKFAFWKQGGERLGHNSS
jgi:hypothetical protein